MKKIDIVEPDFLEIEAPVYTKKQCNDVISVVSNIMRDVYTHPEVTISDIEEYLDRFPFIRKETREHILNVITAHMALYE